MCEGKEKARRTNVERPAIKGVFPLQCGLHAQEVADHLRIGAERIHAGDHITDRLERISRSPDSNGPDLQVLLLTESVEPSLTGESAFSVSDPDDIGLSLWGTGLSEEIRHHIEWRIRAAVELLSTLPHEGGLINLTGRKRHMPHLTLTGPADKANPAVLMASEPGESQGQAFGVSNPLTPHTG